MLAINPTSSDSNITYRWTYILLPALILLLSVILAASFYGRLPPELAYHFTDGSPDGWMSRGAITAWVLIPQFLLLFIGLVISGGTAILSKRSPESESPSLKKVLLIMGNMVALPQIIITFAMLDIFLYNAYQVHLIPLWVFALIVIVAGGLILGLFLIQALRQFRRLPVETSRSENDD